MSTSASYTAKMKYSVDTLMASLANCKKEASQVDGILANIGKRGNLNDFIKQFVALDDAVKMLSNDLGAAKSELGASLQGGYMRTLDSTIGKMSELSKMSQMVFSGLANINLGDKNVAQQLNSFAQQLNVVLSNVGINKQIDLDVFNTQSIQEQFSTLVNYAKNLNSELSIHLGNVDFSQLASNVNTGLGKAKAAVKVAGSQLSDEVQAQIDNLKAKKAELQQTLDTLNGKDISVKTTKKNDVEQLTQLIAKYQEAKVAKEQFEKSNMASGQGYQQAVAEYARMANLLKNTMDYVSESGSEKGSLFVADQLDMYTEAEKFLNKFRDTSIATMSDVKASISTTIQSINAEIKTLKTDDSNVASIGQQVAEAAQAEVTAHQQATGAAQKHASAIQELRGLIEEYKQAMHTANFDDNATDAQVDAAYDKADRLVAKMHELSGMDIGKIQDLLYPFSDEKGLSIDGVVKQFQELLNVETQIVETSSGVQNTVNTLSNSRVDPKGLEKIKNNLREIHELTVKTGNEFAFSLGQSGINSFVQSADSIVKAADEASLAIKSIYDSFYINGHTHPSDGYFSKNDILSAINSYRSGYTNPIMSVGKHATSLLNLNGVSDSALLEIEDRLRNIEAVSPRVFAELQKIFEIGGSGKALQLFHNDEASQLQTAIAEIMNTANDARTPLEKLQSIIMYFSGGAVNGGNISSFSGYWDEFINETKTAEEIFNSIMSKLGVKNKEGQLLQVSGSTVKYPSIDSGILTDTVNQQSDLDETNAKLREQQQLYENLRSTILGLVGESDNLDKINQVLDMVEQEIRTGTLTSLDACIAKFKELGSMHGVDVAAFNPYHQRVADDWEIGGGNRWVDYTTEEVVDKEQYNQLLEREATLTQKVADLRQQLANTPTNASTLEQELAKADAELTEIKGKLEEITTQKLALQGKNQSLDAENMALQSELEKQKQISQEEQNATSQAQQQLQAQTDIAAKAQEELEIEKQKSQVLAEQLKTKQAMVGSATATGTGTTPEGIGSGGTTQGPWALESTLGNVLSTLQTINSNTENIANQALQDNNQQKQSTVKVSGLEAISQNVAGIYGILNGTAGGKSGGTTTPSATTPVSTVTTASSIDNVEKEAKETKAALDDVTQSAQQASGAVENVGKTDFKSTQTYQSLDEMERKLKTTFNSASKGTIITSGSELDTLRVQYNAITGEIVALKNAGNELGVETGGVLNDLQTRAQALLDALSQYKESTKVAYGTNLATKATTNYDGLMAKVEAGGYGNAQGVIGVLNQYKAAYQNVINLQSQFKAGEDLTTKAGRKKSAEFQQAINVFNTYGKQLDDIITKSDDLANRTGAITTPVSAGFNFGDEGSRMSELRNYFSNIQGCRMETIKFGQAYMSATAQIDKGNGVVETMSASFNQAGSAISGMVKQAVTAQGFFNQFFNSLGAKFKNAFGYLASFGSIYRLWHVLRKGITEVREIDKALTELKKVTDETEQTYDKFLQTASKTAAEIGSTVKEITSSAADWARLGYSIKEAAELSASTQILMNVSEFDDVNEATDSLISSIQAFKYTAEESMDVVDIINTIGNNYAISTADLATSLTKSSGSLVAANGTLEEAVALTATANTIIQNSEVVGTALKTVAMRLRGTSVNILEEEGVDTEGAIESISKLQDKVKALSGVNILTDTGAYKSTYQILLEIADVWEDISDINQAALLEILAGKRAGSVMSAILQNPDTLKDAFESAQEAEGSALKENETHLASIQGRIDLFNNSVQTMWMNALNSDAVKFFVDLGKGLIDIVDSLGLINSVVAVLMGYFAISKKFPSMLTMANGELVVFGRTLETIKANYATLQAQGRGKFASGIGALFGTVTTKQDGFSVGNMMSQTQFDDTIEKVTAGFQGLNAAGQSMDWNTYVNGLTDVDDAMKQTLLQVDSTTGGLKTGGSAYATYAGNAQIAGRKIKSVGVASKAAAFGVGLLNTALSMGISLLVSFAISAIIKGIDYLIHRAENLKEEVNELTDAYKNAKEEFSENLEGLEELSKTDSLDGLINEFERLAQGVNQFGENVSLTSDQYERYKELCEAIVGINPDLENGYDNATQAIGNQASALQQLIKLQKTEARLNAQEFVKDNNLTKIADDAINTFEDAKEKVYAYLSYNGANGIHGLSNLFYTEFDWNNVGTKNYGDASSDADDLAKHILELLDVTDIDGALKDYYNEYGYFQFSQFVDAYADIIADNPINMTEGIREWADYYNSAKSALEDAADGLVDSLLQVPLAMSEYDELSTGSQSFITEWIKNSDAFKIDENTTKEQILEMKQTIRNMIIKLSGNQAAQDVLESMFSIDPSKTDWTTYQKDIQEWLTLLYEKLGITDENEQRQLSIALGFEYVIDDTTDDEFVNRAVELGIGTAEEVQQKLDSLPASQRSAILELDLSAYANGEITWEDILEMTRPVATKIKGASQSYDMLAESIENVNSVIAEHSDLFVDNTEITEDQYEAIKELDIAEEDLAKCIDDTNGYVVTNAKELQRLLKVTQSNTKSQVTLAKSQSRLKYRDLYKQIKTITGATGDLTVEQKYQLDSLFDQMDALESVIAKYERLEQQILGTTNAFDEFAEAQQLDEDTDYTDDISEMAKTIISSMEKGEFGTAAMKAAVKALVPESVYKDLDNLKDSWDKVWTYMSQHGIGDYITYEFDDDGFISGATIDQDDVERFVEKAQELGVFTGEDFSSFDINYEAFEEGVPIIDQMTEKLGMTKEMVYALMSACDKYDADWLIGDNSSFLEALDTSVDGKIYRKTQELAELSKKIANGDTSEETTNEYNKLTGELAQLESDALAASLAFDEVNRKIGSSKTKIEEYQKQLQTGYNAEGEALTEDQLAQTEKDLQDELKLYFGYLQEKQNLENKYGVMTESVAQIALEQMGVDVENINEELTKTEDEINGVFKVLKDAYGIVAKINDNGDIEYSIDDNTTQKQKDTLTQLGALNDDGTVNIDVLYSSLTDEQKAEVDKLKTLSEKKNLIDYYLEMNGTDTVQSSLDNISNTLTTISEVLSKPFTITLQSDRGSTGLLGMLWDVLKGGSIGLHVETSGDGATKVNGTAHAYGIAHAQGSWGAKKTETSLVGELGPELLVRGNRWTTVGENGAEFTQVKRGDIIFNHKQTESLLKNGYVAGRGKAYAGGTPIQKSYPLEEEFLDFTNKEMERIDNGLSEKLARMATYSQKFDRFDAEIVNSINREYEHIVQIAKAAEECRAAEERMEAEMRRAVGEYIAAKRAAEDQKKWFEKGVFEDGYQFGDLIRAKLASEQEFSERFVNGIVPLGEQFLDSAYMYFSTLLQNEITSSAYSDAALFNLIGDTESAEACIEYAGETNKAITENTSEFVAKDLYDEEKVAEAITGHEFFVKITGIDPEADSILGDKSESLIQSAGHLAATAAANQLGIPWYLTSFMTASGAEAENALKQGATYDEALLSSTITGLAEVLTEKIGGISFGGKTLTDGISDFVTKDISDEFFKKIFEVGIKTFLLGEGTEEGLSGDIGRFGQWITYQDDKTFAEMFWSDEARQSRQDEYWSGLILGEASKFVKNSIKGAVDETRDPLVLTSNMRSDKFTENLQNGGIPSPSTAVKEYNVPHIEFGEYGLTFPMKFADPTLYPGVKNWGADAWTPQQLDLKINPVFNEYETANAVDNIKKSIGDTYVDELFPDSVEQFKDLISQNSGSIYNAYWDNLGIRTAYAMQHGLISQIPTIDGKVDTQKLNSQLVSAMQGSNESWRNYKFWLADISNSTIESFDKPTNIDYLNNMAQQQASGKIFKLSNDGLIVPPVEYFTLDEMIQNKDRLSSDASVVYNQLQEKFMSFANDLADSNDTDIQLIVDIINEAYSSRYDVDMISQFFADKEVNISKRMAKKLQDLYRKSVELPTEYFESKLDGEIRFNQADHANIPAYNTSYDDLARLIELGQTNIIPYGDSADRLVKEEFGKRFMFNSDKALRAAGLTMDEYRVAQQEYIEAILNYSQSVSNGSEMTAGFDTLLQESAEKYDNIVDRIMDAYHLQDQIMNTLQRTPNFVPNYNDDDDDEVAIVERIAGLWDNITGNKETNYTVNTEYTESNTEEKPKFSLFDKSNWFGGKAHAYGDSGLPTNEHNALVGELGREMVVDPNAGRYYTVGDNGAEMVDLPKGAIIFDHKQTEGLLNNGHISSRGEAYVTGNAHAVHVLPPYGESQSEMDGNSDGTHDSDSSSASDAAEQIVDFIKYKLEEIEEIISKTASELENIADDTSKTVVKNGLYDKLIQQEYNKKDTYYLAKDEYSKKANSLLNKIPETYSLMAQNGAIAIRDFVGEDQEEIASAIEEYRTWAQKVADAETGYLEAIANISAKRLEQLQDISDDFDNIISLSDNKSDEIQSQIDFIEESGQRVSASLYEKLQRISADKIDDLKHQQQEMQNILDNAVNSGDVNVGSDDWYEMVNAINDVDDAILECTTDIEEFQNAINDIYWDNFEKLIDQIDAIDSELSNLFDLLSDDDKVVDEFGNWTDDGIASLGLLAQQMENAQAKANEYKQAMDDLERNKANYSIDEYNEKMAELKDSYLSEIKNIEDLKDSMVDLNKVRVDAVKEAIDKEIEALEEKNEKLKESLDLEKEQYDWQKSVAEKEKYVADIRRRINALAGDTSASAIAERRKLQAELAEAQQEMDDMWYEHGIEEQQKSLDESLENYKENKEDEKEALDEWLEEEEKVIQESFDLFNSNVGVVASVLEAFEQEHGIKLSEAIVNPWNSGIDAMEAYRQKLAEMKQEQEDAKQVAEDTADDIVESLNETQASTPTTSPVVSQPSASEPTSETSKSTESTTPSYKDYTIKKNDTLSGIAKSELGSATRWQEIYNLNKDVISNPNLIYPGQKIKLPHYAKGTMGAEYDHWAMVDELGPELQLVPDGSGRLSYITRGTSVIPHDLSEKLVDLALDPTKVLENSRPAIGAPHITTNNFDIDLSFGSLVHVDHCDQNTLPDLQKMVRGEFNNMMKDLNQKLKRK